MEDDYFIQLDFKNHTQRHSLHDVVKASLSLGDVVLFKDEFASKIVSAIESAFFEKKVTGINLVRIKRAVYCMWKERKMAFSILEELGREIPEAFTVGDSIAIDEVEKENNSKVFSSENADWLEFCRMWDKAGF